MGMIDRVATWRDDAERGDGLEVAPVIYLEDAVERTEDASKASAWGVYVHLPEGGVFWIADYETRHEAVKFAERAASEYPNLNKYGISNDWP